MFSSPIIKSINIELTPFQVLKLFEPHRGLILLESSGFNSTDENLSIIVLNPAKIFSLENEKFIEISDGAEKIIPEEPLEYLKNLLMQKIDADYPAFYSGLVGYFSYDFGKRFENIRTTKEALMDLPELFFGYYDNCLIYDHIRKTWYAAGTKDVDLLVEMLYSKVGNVYKINSEKIFSTEVILKSNYSYQDYIESVLRAKNYIQDGDIYQVNLTQQFFGHTSESAIDIYSKLRKINPAPYSAFMCLGENKYILSSSPELFLQVDDRFVKTKPIKGTIKRGKDVDEDLFLKQKLLTSQKDQAELTMIVDLERNDLNRVCKTGTVKVRDLKKIETYSSVHHLVAEIVGELDDGFDIFDLIKATFPGGSITGAPKIRAMQIIGELEPNRRGVYTGSIGYISLNKKAKFNIAIRTICYDNGKISIGLGGGIVADSIPELEYQETLHKGKAIFEALKANIL